MDFEDAIAAPSTAQSSSESTATFGRKSSGSGGHDDLPVATLGPIDEVLDKDLRPTAAPAVSSGTGRGRQERKDRSDRSSSSKPSSSKVMTKVTSKSPTSVRSSDRKSKSPRSSRGSARESAPGKSDRNPEIALEQLIAETGGGLKTNPLPVKDDMLNRIAPDYAELSDVNDTVDLRTIRGKRERSQHRGEHHENMVDIGETEEQQDFVKRAKAGCPDCAEHEKQKASDDSLIRELQNRLELAGNQAKHFIDNARLLERHIEEKGRELAEAIRVGEALTNDLRLKLDEKSETSRRLEEDLGGSVRELGSCQNDLLNAKEQIENLRRAQRYQEEQHRASLADLDNKIHVACMEDDTGKVQLSVELRESVRTVGELQSELTNKVRQLDLIQTEVRRITDSRDSVVEEKEKLEQRAIQHQRELQRVTAANVITEKKMVRLTKESRALDYVHSGQS